MFMYCRIFYTCLSFVSWNLIKEDFLCKETFSHVKKYLNMSKKCPKFKTLGHRKFGEIPLKFTCNLIHCIMYMGTVEAHGWWLFNTSQVAKFCKNKCTLSLLLTEAFWLEIKSITSVSSFNIAFIFDKEWLLHCPLPNQVTHYNWNEFFEEEFLEMLTSFEI